MKKWLKTHKILAIVVATAAMAIIGPLLINEAYRPNKGYITVWTGPEFLGYYGTILGAVATIIALVATIEFSRRQILFERHVQREMEKWKEIEGLFRTAIIYAEPSHLTSMFYNNLQNKGLDFCMELETYLIKLSEAMDYLDVTIEEDDEPAVQELLMQLKTVETEDKKAAREYDDLISFYWQWQNGELKHVTDLMTEFAKSRNEINAKVESLRQNEYQKLLQMKKSTFAKIYDRIDIDSRNILVDKE